MARPLRSPPSLGVGTSRWSIAVAIALVTASIPQPSSLGTQAMGIASATREACSRPSPDRCASPGRDRRPWRPVARDLGSGAQRTLRALQLGPAGYLPATIGPQPGADTSCTVRARSSNEFFFSQFADDMSGASVPHDLVIGVNTVASTSTCCGSRPPGPAFLTGARRRPSSATLPSLAGSARTVATTDRWRA